MSTMKTWDLTVMSDLVVIGRQEEEGYEIIRERWYLVACDASGRQFSQCILFSSQVEADEHATQMARDGGVDPVRSNWYEMTPAYGSEAYVTQGSETELLALERREAGL
jgi:hypothetical protein